MKVWSALGRCGVGIRAFNLGVAYRAGKVVTTPMGCIVAVSSEFH